MVRLERKLGDGIDWRPGSSTPSVRSVTVVAADGPVRSLYEGDVLDGGTVVPGLTCAVAEIFDGIERPS